LCEFVWRNSCSKYCVNLYGGILVQSIVWICMEEFLFKVLCEFEWRNSCSKYCVNLYGGILVQCNCVNLFGEFLFKVRFLYLSVIILITALLNDDSYSSKNVGPTLHIIKWVVGIFKYSQILLHATKI